MQTNIPTSRNTFKKCERLCSEKIIGDLFKNGKFGFSHPIKIVWLEYGLHTEMPVQIVISVPKRIFKKAVDRNLLKRRIREAYRKHKFIIYDYLKSQNIQIALGFVFAGKGLSDYFEIEEKIILLLHKIIKEHAKGN